LKSDHLQQREKHWATVDLVGKGGHVRTVPVPDWVRTELDDWLAAAAIDRGKLCRRVNKVGRTWEDGMTVEAVWRIQFLLGHVSVQTTSATLGANTGFDQPSTIGPASSRILELGARKDCRQSTKDLGIRH